MGLLSMLFHQNQDNFKDQDSLGNLIVKKRELLSTLNSMLNDASDESVSDSDELQADKLRIQTLQSSIEKLESLQLQYSNLSIMTDVIYLKSSSKVLSDKLLKLRAAQIETLSGKRLLNPLRDAIDNLNSFTDQLYQSAVEKEQQMIESIIDVTLKENSHGN